MFVKLVLVYNTKFTEVNSSTGVKLYLRRRFIYKEETFCIYHYLLSVYTIVPQFSVLEITTEIVSL